MNIRKFCIMLMTLLMASTAVSCAPKTPPQSEQIVRQVNKEEIEEEIEKTSIPDVENDIFDEEVLTKRALDYVTEFQKGNFKTIFTDADEALVSRCSEEELRQSWTSLLNNARTFRGQQTFDISAAANAYQVDVYSVHARYRICSAFVFDKDQKVSEVSFSLMPLIVKPESGETWYETAIHLGYDKEKPLNGMLALPKNVKNPPVAILVQGSGKNNMDSLIGESDNRFFADLAHGLAERGIASIRYDKRSYAYPEDVTDIQTEYFYDVKDAVRFVQEDQRVDGERLYLVGHSQGGMLSPKLISDNPEFKGLISMGGTLRRMEDLILEQNQMMNAKNNQLTSEEKQSANDSTASLVEKMKALGAGAAASPDVLLYGYPETYWKSLNEIDNLALAKKLAAENYPMLILQGVNDFQVTFNEDYALWQEVVAESTHAACIAYEGLSHVFMPGSPEFDQRVYNPPSHVDIAVIQDMAEWINQ